MKLIAPEEIMFCHRNEKGTNHFSLLISPEDSFCSQCKRSPMHIRRGNKNNDSQRLTIFI